jgi:histidyl-tRNA synthetase
VEILGPDDPRTDAELLIMVIHFLGRFGLKDLELEINSLGCLQCRPAFREAVVRFIRGGEEGLCGDCRRRIDANPLRVFDCKVDTCREVISKAPRLTDFICATCREHFSEVGACLTRFDIPYTVNTAMVRGLDYYTRTTFEVTTRFLGAQNAILGGGRYDHLVRDLGGPDISGIGFAIGMERLAALIPEQATDAAEGPFLFIAALGEKAVDKGFALCNALRMRGIRVEMEYKPRSLKSQMKRADRLRSAFALILGDREIEQDRALLRDMRASTQEEIGLEGLEETIIKIAR